MKILIDARKHFSRRWCMRYLRLQIEFLIGIANSNANDLS
jgi:hypothetical protein